MELFELSPEEACTKLAQLKVAVDKGLIEKEAAIDLSSIGSFLTDRKNLPATAALAGGLGGGLAGGLSGYFGERDPEAKTRRGLSRALTGALAGAGLGLGGGLGYSAFKGGTPPPASLQKIKQDEALLSQLHASSQPSKIDSTLMSGLGTAKDIATSGPVAGAAIGGGLGAGTGELARKAWIERPVRGTDIQKMLSQTPLEQLEKMVPSHAKDLVGGAQEFAQRAPHKAQQLGSQSWARQILAKLRGKPVASPQPFDVLVRQFNQGIPSSAGLSPNMFDKADPVTGVRNVKPGFGARSQLESMVKNLRRSRSALPPGRILSGAGRIGGGLGALLGAGLGASSLYNTFATPRQVDPAVQARVNQLIQQYGGGQ